MKSKLHTRLVTKRSTLSRSASVNILVIKPFTNVESITSDVFIAAHTSLMNLSTWPSTTSGQ